MDFNFTRVAQNMIRNQLGTDIVSNNLANIATTGFKKDSHFTDWLTSAIDTGAARRYTDFSQGEMKQTENPLDFALSSKGFFVLDGPAGAIYTRNGHFRVSIDGLIESQAPHLLQGEHGALSILSREGAPGQVKVSSEGLVFVDGIEIDRLLIANVPDIQSLVKLGANTFRAGDNVVISQLEPETIGIQQGFLEGSNVQPVEEMVRLIEMQRNYESTQRIARAMDSVEGRAISLSDYR